MYYLYKWDSEKVLNFCENFRNFEEVELVENLHPNYLPYRFFAYFATIFAMGKMELSIKKKKTKKKKQKKNNNIE